MSTNRFIVWPARPAIANSGRYIRSGRQQMIKLRNLIRFALRVGDDDMPAFARPDSGLGDDDKSAGSFDFYGLVVAFCDHLVSQLGPSRIHDASHDASWL